MFSKLTLILMILLLLAVGVSFFAIKGCQNNKKIIKVATKVSEHINDTVTHKVDKEGLVHSDKTVIDVDRKSLELFYKDKSEKLSEKLNIALRQISVMSDASLHATDTFFSKSRIDTIYLKDSVKVLANCFDYYDTFTHIYACIEKMSQKDSLLSYCQYQIDVPINLTVYWRRKHKVWFLRYGRKIDSTDMYSDNPNIQISDLNYIRIKQ